MVKSALLCARFDETILVYVVFAIPCLKPQTNHEFVRHDLSAPAIFFKSSSVGGRGGHPFLLRGISTFVVRSALLCLHVVMEPNNLGVFFVTLLFSSLLVAGFCVVHLSVLDFLWLLSQSALSCCRRSARD